MTLFTIGKRYHTMDGDTVTFERFGYLSSNVAVFRRDDGSAMCTRADGSYRWDGKNHPCDVMPD